MAGEAATEILPSLVRDAELKTQFIDGNTRHDLLGPRPFMPTYEVWARERTLSITDAAEVWLEACEEGTMSQLGTLRAVKGIALPTGGGIYPFMRELLAAISFSRQEVSLEIPRYLSCHTWTDIC